MNSMTKLKTVPSEARIRMILALVLKEDDQNG